MGTRKPIFTPLVALPVFWVVLFRATAFPSLGPLSAPNTTGDDEVREVNAHVRALFQNPPVLPSVELDLLSAARDGDMKRAEEAIHLGATGRASTPSELFTPLIFAARGGHTDVAQMLLDLKVDPNWQTRSGITALWIASFMGHAKIVQALLNIESVIVDLANSKGMTPLYAASEQEHMGIVGALLKKGADPDLPSDNGATPLVAAAQIGDAIIVDILAAKGADVNAKKQPLHRPALWIASYFGHVDVVKILVARGADVNLASEDGRTALFAASQQDWETIVLFLLESHADVTLSRNDGLTPLHIAAVLGHFGVVESLIRFGADPLAENDKGQTAGDMLEMKSINIPEGINTILTLGSAGDEGMLLNASSGPSSVLQPSYSMVPIPTQVNEVVQPPRKQEDLDEVDPVLHSSNPTNVSSSKGHLSAPNIAVILPLTVLGFLLVVAFAFFVKNRRKAIFLGAYSTTDCKRANVRPSQPPQVLPDISYHPRHSMMESSPSPEIIDVAFADAQIEISPQRNAMETNRSHIFMDGHYPELDIPPGGATDLTPLPSTTPVMTWNWMSEDGPGETTDAETMTQQHPVGVLHRCISSCRFDSSMLHDELKLDEEITQSQHEHWWSPSRKQVDSQRAMVSRAATSTFPYSLGYTSPTRIVTATNVAPVGSSTEVDFRVFEHLPVVEEGSCSHVHQSFPNAAENVQDNGTEVLTRHVRRSRSEELFYYMKDGTRRKISGSAVRMTADEGISSNAVRTDGDRNKRIIRVLYKDR